MKETIKSIIAIISVSVFAMGLSFHPGNGKKQAHSQKIEKVVLISDHLSYENASPSAWHILLNKQIAIEKYEHAVAVSNYTQILVKIYSENVKKQQITNSKIYIHSNYAQIQAPGNLLGTMQCIKNHESGNYAESTHIYDGSGAYQVIPSTWRTWSVKAGYGGYSYAYLAPASVQDAVVSYMLTNGGAGNWSPRYGNDPCTVGTK